MIVSTEVCQSMGLLTLHGPLATRPEGQTVCRLIKELVSRGIVDVRIDLKSVDWMGAAGVGALVCGFKAVKAAGGAIRLAGVTKPLRRVFVVAGVLRLFENRPRPACQDVLPKRVPA